MVVCGFLFFIFWFNKVAVGHGYLCWLVVVAGVWAMGGCFGCGFCVFFI